MLLEQLKKSNSKIIISTGNILNVHKKTGQKPTEELFDCLNATINEPVVKNETGEVCRCSDDLQQKMSEHERDSIKIGAKVFLNYNSVEYLEEAINALFRTLNVENLDNLILAYHPKTCDEQNRSETAHTEQKEGVIEWGGKNSEALQDLKALWKRLEVYGNKKMVCQLGIADLDVDSLKQLCEGCEIYPTIAQINLAACCVVPPALQEFCNQNDIQLLTHSDPEVILTESSLTKLHLKEFIPTWTVRYQVHVKCRGLLTAKGYIVGSRKKKDAIPLQQIIQEF